MTGTEKQISWAQKIISDFQATINAAASRFEAAGKVEDGAKLRAGVTTLVERHPEASWWIDCRDLKGELRTVVMG